MGERGRQRYGRRHHGWRGPHRAGKNDDCSTLVQQEMMIIPLKIMILLIDDDRAGRCLRDAHWNEGVFCKNDDFLLIFY